MGSPHLHADHLATASPWHFSSSAEPVPGESTVPLGEAAKKFGVFVVGGSLPEREGNKVYNTCTVWGPQGNMVAKYRKVHLFDVNMPGELVIQESYCISPGNTLTTFDLPQCKIGLGICYDMNFPEMARLYAKLGCKVVLYPGAFSMVTGPTQWELLQQCRALDNQVYVVTVSRARNTNHSYVSWGHSSIVNPFGKVIATCEEKETIVYGDLDMEYVNKVRQMFPLLKQLRDDVYEVMAK
ncbi:omega-amidase NIT2-like [Eriocheir sinensis]|uniref:omega-amidase NIT2-like n=1 Tax=Eriocheir sinensis TaxID=95602 RepID=UPI0021C712D3|nr:omega-amidase NIT2-like [Eriocheir sinensis]XP_050690984.1 omega-amidase NIT2-like [Eriocheir sinensis]